MGIAGVLGAASKLDVVLESRRIGSAIVASRAPPMLAGVEKLNVVLELERDGDWETVGVVDTIDGSEPMGTIDEEGASLGRDDARVVVGGAERADVG